MDVGARAMAGCKEGGWRGGDGEHHYAHPGRGRLPKQKKDFMVNMQRKWRF